MTYEVTSTGIAVIDDVEVDIAVRGDEKKVDKTMMDLKEQCGRIGAAFDQKEPPRDLDEFPVEYVPIVTVNWNGIFENDG